MSIIRPIMRDIIRPITRSIICGIRRVPLITEQPQDEAVNTGQQAAFSVAAEVDEGSLEYQWQVDDGSGFSDISGETSTTLTLTSVLIIQTGFKYRCIVKANGFTVASSFALLIVIPI